MNIKPFHRRFLRTLSDVRPALAEQACTVELLEDRRLLAASISLRALSDASETNPTGGGLGQFYIKRTGSTSQPLTVRYRRAGGTTAGTGDYQTLTGTIVINKGRDKVFLNVAPIDDTRVESTEKLVLSVDTSSAYTIDGSYRYNNIDIEDNDGGGPTPSTSFTAPITVAVGSTARTDKVVEQAVNFTTLIGQGGGSGSLIENSIRVVETNSTGSSVLNSNVTYQFDKSGSFNALSNASGNLVFLAAGNSAANGTRYFKVTFATAGSFSAPSFSDEVVVTDNVTRAQRTAIRIVTDQADYYLEKDAGGFSSIVDKNGADWLSESPTGGSGAGGEFRGLPNAGPDGVLHAGFDRGDTTIVSDGVLKATFRSSVEVNTRGDSVLKTFTVRYDVYPTYTRATFEVADDNYWFLYEGTPGGAVNSNDSAVFSDGTTISDITTATEGSSTDFDQAISTGNNEEWAYFRDSAANKYLFVTHEQPDSVIDAYFTLTSGSGTMTVFGIGRDQGASALSGLGLTGNNSFTFGIGDGGSNSTTTGNEIRETFKSLTVNLGSGAAA